MNDASHTTTTMLDGTCAWCDEGDILSPSAPHYVLDTCHHHGTQQCRKYQMIKNHLGQVTMDFKPNEIGVGE